MKEKKHWKRYVEDEGLIKLEKISGKEASNMFFKGTKEMLMTMMASALKQLYDNTVFNKNDLYFLITAVLESDRKEQEDESK